MSGQSQVPLESLVTRIETEPVVWVRLAASKLGDDWQIRLLEVTAGEAPPSWQLRRWVYPRAVFFAFSRKGTTVARWLRSRRILVGPYRIPLQGLAGTVSCDRRESRWSGLYEPLEWPSEEWRLTDQTEHTQQPPDDLVADGAPSFVTFAVAWASLLGIESSSNRSFSGSELVVRRQDTTGRLASVHVRATEVQVRLEGHHLRGAVVELAGNQPGPSRRLTRNAAHTVRFPLPGGLPPGSWVVLRKGDGWIDRRFLSWPYALAQQPGVEHVVEPSTRLEVLLAGGEGPTTEFKASLPGDDDDSKRKAMKTVAAFANGDGGSILFGVSDDGEVIGLTPADAGPKARDRLSNLIRNWVSQLVAFHVESLPATTAKDRRVLVLTVEPGDSPPYGAGTQPTDLVYYVRRGATSFPISAHEVRELARSRPPADQPQPYFSAFRR